MIYQTFASLYDELMEPALYEDWLSFVQQRTPKSKLPVNLLELACGTGTLATMLAVHNYEVTGVDISTEMLTLADQKSTDARVSVTYLEADMLDLSELPTYQMVTCLDDSLCYMSDIQAVGKVFAQVFNHLTSSGRFLFDMHSIFQMDELFPEYMYNYKEEDRAFMWTSYEGEFPHSIVHDLTFFVFDEQIDGYQAMNELHFERTYELAKIVEQLEKTGFKQIKVSADFGNNEVEADSTRWFFEATKE